MLAALLRRRSRYVPRHLEPAGSKWKKNTAPILGHIGAATAYPNRSGCYPANPALVPEWPTMRIELPSGGKRNQR